MYGGPTNEWRTYQCKEDLSAKLYWVKIVQGGTIFATKIVPPGTILVAKCTDIAKSVPGSEKGPLAI